MATRGETIELVRGTNPAFRYEHTTAAGEPTSLVGCTVYFTVKADEFDNDAQDIKAMIALTITSHDDAAGGITSEDFSVPAVNWEPGDYYYDVVVKDSNNKIYPIVMGKVKLVAKPTNRSGD